MRKIFYILFLALIFSGCGIYSFTGGQFSGAKTFSVGFFKSQTPLASPVYSQKLTESLKDIMLSQSPLKLAEQDGELQFEGAVTGYSTAPTAIQSGTETASLSRLTISVKVKYNNTIDPSLSFDKVFTKFSDYDSDRDLFTIEEELWQQINDQLTVEIYNASVGNW